MNPLYFLGQEIVQWVQARRALLHRVFQENSPASATLLSDWDLQAFAQCRTLEHLLDFDFLAGHYVLGCDWPRHLDHCASGVFPLLGLGFFFCFFISSLESFPFPLDKQSTWAGGGSDLASCRNVCCLLTVSDCLVFVISFSKANLESSCTCSESFLSFILTTIPSRMRSSLSVPNSQYSARQYKSVMKLSTDSPTCWLLRLNFALSNITFLFTTKWTSNALYCFASSVVGLNETTMPSVSSLPSFWSSPVAFRNRSKRLIQRDYSSDLKWNFSVGGAW